MTTRKLIIDCFAGGGGASTGIEMALGRSPDYAVNHDRLALAMHSANHPDTVHLSENIWQVDPLAVVRNRPVGLLWFSPDCTHFSKAKGGKPVKAGIRDLAWTLINWLRRARPEVVFLENVEEFKTWGPLTSDHLPCPRRKGQTFNEWIEQIRRLGYRVEWRELRACDYGAPTIRKRLILIARRDGIPIVWPKPTHGDPRSEAVRSGRLLPWKTAAEIIDWHLPCPSIFDTSEQIFEKFGIRAKRPLADATMARIRRGVKRYVLDAAEPFVVNVNYTGDGGPREYPIGEPLRTMTGTRSEAVVTPFVSYGQHGGANRSAEDPLHTITASQKDQNLIVAPTLVQTGYGERDGQAPRALDIEAPIGTQVAGGAKHALVAAFMAQHNTGVTGHAMTAPVSTIVAGKVGSTQALVAASISRQFGASIGSGIDEPVGTVTAGGGGKSALVSAHISMIRNSGKPTSGADEPMHTITAQGANPTLVAAHLTKFNSGSTGSDLADPAPTITANSFVKRPGGSAPIGLAAATMTNLRGTNQAGGPVDSPLWTETAAGNHAGLVAAFLNVYYGTDQAPELSDPLPTDTTKDRFGLVQVMIDGEPFVISDIGMRMLTPRERFRAQGFPDSFEIETGILQDGSKVRLTLDQQGRMCGNSVCPPLAEAVIRANCADLVAGASRFAAE